MNEYTEVIFNPRVFLWEVYDPKGNLLDSFVTEELAIEYARYH